MLCCVHEGDLLYLDNATLFRYDPLDARCNVVLDRLPEVNSGVQGGL